VIDTVNELPDIIEEINRRMEIGVGPWNPDSGYPSRAGGVDLVNLQFAGKK
jgi:hypothetical protein